MFPYFREGERRKQGSKRISVVSGSSLENAETVRFIQFRVQLVHCTLPLKDFLKGGCFLISMGSELSSSHPRGMYRGEFFWCTFQWGRKCGNVAAQETDRGTPVWDPVTFMGGSC